MAEFLSRSSLLERKEFARRSMISLLLFECCPGHIKSVFDSAMKSSYMSSIHVAKLFTGPRPVSHFQNRLLRHKDPICTTVSVYQPKLHRCDKQYKYVKFSCPEDRKDNQISKSQFLSGEVY